ncbi:NADP-dependent oxidoreductase [Agromyces sp. LHK192]|uniref:NADP-dependent oxidoreductase n=1 Tax=Agromyces sp. LHK192 TaxID=2498704 RepID=UPI000FDB7F85|nr:NADP-dependent oxidoreductase [Agromyces sp. LHK192]
MHALRAYAAHDPSRLEYEDAPEPRIGARDALVRVRASGVSPGELDWPTSWLEHDGSPRTPPIVIGHEVSGVVAALGAELADDAPVAVGAEVFGFIDIRRDGADAELVAVDVDELAPKPAGLTHAEASAVPLSALTAWQALFDHGQLMPGQRVLVHGGAGGVGTFAVQFAAWRGAHVIATASAGDAAFVESLGADEVIDFRATRFEDAATAIDLVVDTVGGQTWERSWDVLGPEGRIVSIAVPRPPDTEPRDGRRAIWFVVRPDVAQLMEIGDLADAGRVHPVVADERPVSEGRSAYGGGARRSGPGKVVLVVGD